MVYNTSEVVFLTFSIVGGIVSLTFMVLFIIDRIYNIFKK